MALKKSITGVFEIPSTSDAADEAAHPAVDNQNIAASSIIIKMSSRPVGGFAVQSE